MGVRFFHILFWAAILACPVFAQDKPSPVSFDADQLLYDDQDEVVTAIGNVRIEQDGRVVTADSVLYKIKEDRVTAVGNVKLVETDGSQYFAEKVQLRDKMREGYISHLSGVLGDGGRFTAAYAKREVEDKDDVISLKNATYTTCAPCKKNPDKEPTWQFRAEEVEHNRDEKRVSYDNATFEVSGVPILWTPYFSHPDGTENQKSGLIKPILGYDSELGGYAGTTYYFAIDKDKDASLGLTAYTDEYPVLSGEYRQRFNDAAIDLSGTTTYSSRVVNTGTSNVELNEELRGNFFAQGVWNINKKWRSGFDINLTSDDQYLRQYDITDDDILENELYLERFSGRNYTDARLIGFQDVRLISEQTDTPNILPEITASFLGDAGQTFGGRWALDVSALSLQRDGSDPDTNRLSTEIGWQGHRKTNIGLVTTLDVGARGDLYYLTDRPGQGDESETRGYVFANLEAAYPFIKTLEKTGSQIVVEPIVSLTGITDVNNQGDVTNEDSQDIQVSANNLFDQDRFTGFDRIEDRPRVTYGLRSTYYDANDLELSAFAGQSYHFEEESFFPRGSGLREKSSDYVGQLSASYQDKFGVHYRTRLDRNTLSSKAHEVDLGFSTERLELNSLYFFSKAVEGTNFDETREQFTGAGRFKVSDNWYVSGGTVYDLGQDPGLREADFGIEYVGECLSIGTFVERDLTDDNSGDAATEISIRIGLKNLATFEASGLELFEGNQDN